MKKGELRHIHVEPADNGGAVVKVHKKMQEGRKNTGPWLADNTEETHTHQSPEEAGKHVTELLRNHFGKGGDASGVRGGEASKGGKSAKPKDQHATSDDGPDAEYA